jgi:hypothetical protein
MTEWVSVVFDGIGTEIISLFIGGILGGFTGFGICKHQMNVRQAQNAGSFSELHQNGNAYKVKNRGGEENVLIQSQKAGDHSKLFQE